MNILPATRLESDSAEYDSNPIRILVQIDLHCFEYLGIKMPGEGVPPQQQRTQRLNSRRTRTVPRPAARKFFVRSPALTALFAMFSLQGGTRTCTRNPQVRNPKPKATISRRLSDTQPSSSRGFGAPGHRPGTRPCMFFVRSPALTALFATFSLQGGTRTGTRNPKPQSRHLPPFPVGSRTPRQSSSWTSPRPDTVPARGLHVFCTKSGANRLICKL